MNKPRKPRGEMPMLSGDSRGLVLRHPRIGDTKEDLERHVATAFLRGRTDWSRSEPCFEWLGIDEAVHNDTSDLDVSLKRGGRLVAYAELVEFAPLRPGLTYANAPGRHNVRERAEQVLALITKKWAKYSTVETPIFLVIYCTDEVFMPDIASTLLVSHWLFTRPNTHGFEGVFLRGTLPNLPNQMLYARVFSERYLDGVRRSGFDETRCKGDVYSLRARDFRPG